MPISALSIAFLSIFLQFERPKAAATPAVADRAAPLDPASVKMGGLLGDRYEQSERNRLLTIDEKELLSGFQQKPGKQAWVGEHVGKWLHAAVLTWQSTKNPELRTKIERVRDALLSCQEPDGYLGTYTKEKRFGLFNNSDWDVWVHKYCLIGLLTEYEYTGHAPSLAACRKIGDLLCLTFGKDKKSILSAGQHAGMAATSVLEPMVLLYRWTGDAKYAEFCKYIISSWSEPGGPDILNNLLIQKRVHEFPSAKSYEMLSNFVGLCEWYRQTGDAKLFKALEWGWSDIVKNQIYPTGSGSSFEYWQRDGARPLGNDANLCEVCVTVTWMQFNIQLFRLTGDYKYFDEIEKTAFNHLIGAQSADGKSWSYYTAFEGKKPFTTEIHCCGSSGPRGLAMLPMVAASVKDDNISINALYFSRMQISRNGVNIYISNNTDFPYDGNLDLWIRADAAVDATLQIRAPLGCEFVDKEGPRLLNITKSFGTESSNIINKIRYITSEERLTCREGEKGFVALRRGPLVLCAGDLHSDTKYANRRKLFLNRSTDRAVTQIEVIRPPNQNYQFKGPRLIDLSHYNIKAPPGSTDVAEPVLITPYATPSRSAGYYKFHSNFTYIPFGEACDPKENYITFVPDRKLTDPVPLALGATADYSRKGNVDGDIADGDITTFRVTFNETLQKEDWFSLKFPRSVEISKIVFRHGRTFHDGGWFNAKDGGKPRVEICNKEGAWIEVAKLQNYPDTTATDSKGLRPGDPFEATFPPVEGSAVRIVGMGACGDDPRQNFSSCAELEVY